MRALVLAGTAEARALADALEAAGVAVLSSFAGATSAPLPRAGAVRQGGFGGAEGLAAVLRDGRFGALMDATHPFAARMAANAAAAAEATGTPRLKLLRPGWQAEPGWTFLPDLAAAAAALPRGARVFLSTGRQSFAAFAARSDLWVLARAAEPGPFPFAAGHLETGLPPFGAEAEAALMRRHGITHLVLRDSGGERGKLDAAAALGLAVLMIRRPDPPPGPLVHSVAAALDWIGQLRG